MIYAIIYSGIFINIKLIFSLEVKTDINLCKFVNYGIR